MAKQKTERQIDFVNRFGSPRQWAGAITVGLVSGYITLRKTVNSKFHEFMMKNQDLKNRFLHESIPGEVRKSLEQLAAEHKDKLKEMEPGSDLYKAAAKAFRKLIGTEKASLRQFEDRIAATELNIPVGGIGGAFKGLFKRLDVSSPDSRMGVYFASLIAVGAGIGTSLMIFNQLNTRDKLNELDKAAGDTNRKLDSLIDRTGADRPRKLLTDVDDTPSPKTSKREAILTERASTQHATAEGRLR